METSIYFCEREVYSVMSVFWLAAHLLCSPANHSKLVNLTKLSQDLRDSRLD